MAFEIVKAFFIICAVLAVLGLIGWVVSLFTHAEPHYPPTRQEEEEALYDFGPEGWDETALERSKSPGSVRYGTVRRRDANE
jgi:hypothetical protein